MPFFILLPVSASRNSTLMTIVIVILFVGQYVEQYLEIVPGVTGQLHFGFLEIGSFIGFAGLFSLVVSYALSRAKLIPVHHPYLEESLEHKFA